MVVSLGDVFGAAAVMRIGDGSAVVGLVGIGGGSFRGLRDCGDCWLHTAVPMVSVGVEIIGGELAKVLQSLPRGCQFLL